MLLKSDFNLLWGSCKLTADPGNLKLLEYVCKIVLANQERYRLVEASSLVPWPLIAAIHFRESDQDFTRHLHNGDPLSDRTIHVPKNRPSVGTPPFTWVTSAIDALSLVWLPKTWDIPGCLEFLERYNGLGYRKRMVASPYIWNFTDQYQAGLFVSDGYFDPNKRESRPGCVSILKTLQGKGVSLEFTNMVAADRGLH